MAREPSYGDKRSNKVGILVALALHVLVGLLVLYQKNVIMQKAAPPASVMVFLPPPSASKPKQKQEPVKPRKVVKTEAMKMVRLPNTITPPNEKPVELTLKPKLTPISPDTPDMASLIAARRKARGATEPQSAPAEESENDRRDRIARANIAAANGRSAGVDPNDTGGMFELTGKTYRSATLKFRGWNTNFKRRWLSQVEVERGNEPDIETAIVNKMIEIIRKEKQGDFEWESHRLHRTVPMSARVKDTAELQAFLMKEMFPEYIPPRTASR